MHVFTVVITPGSRGTAYERAYRLSSRAAAESFDWWMVGGRFSGRLQELGLLPADDPWSEAIPASRLPSPLPNLLVPPALITPKGAFLWEPLRGPKATTWTQRVNRLIDQYRGGHTVVLMDGHC
ncbi:MAG: hypothetical protein WKF94_11960 [Solirubrobacteraceae bacterium]